MSYRHKPEWITVTVGAEYAGTPARTVRYWAATGKIKARRHGARWQVERKSLEMYAWCDAPSVHWGAPFGGAK